MPINVTITAEELKALLAERDAARALREEHEALRGALRLMTAERDLAEERLRAYRRELFGAKSEARDSDQLGLFNEAEVLGANSAPAQEDTPETTVGAHKRKKRGHRKPLDPNLPREVVRHELPRSRTLLHERWASARRDRRGDQRAARCDPRAASSDPTPAR
jgi:hypothetical protein